MLRYLLKRSIWGLLTLFVFVSVMFFAVQIMIPHDFTTQFVVSMTPDERQALQNELGLDLPIAQRYFKWLAGITRLDLGTSYRGMYYGTQPVIEIIKGALPYTLLIFFHRINNCLSWRAMAGEVVCMARSRARYWHCYLNRSSLLFIIPSVDCLSGC